MYYVNYFFLYSIIGHLVETLTTSGFTSGILYGWWTPVYGIGVVLILLISKLINKINLKNKRLFKVILTYLICMIILSIIELVGGYLIELIFKQEFWNYENHKFHIGPYIYLEMANIWGIASILVIYILKPISDKIIKYFPKWLTYILIVLFTIDVLYTIISK